MLKLNSTKAVIDKAIDCLLSTDGLEFQNKSKNIYVYENILRYYSTNIVEYDPDNKLVLLLRKTNSQVERKIVEAIYQKIKKPYTLVYTYFARNPNDLWGFISSSFRINRILLLNHFYKPTKETTQFYNQLKDMIKNLDTWRKIDKESYSKFTNLIKLEYQVLQHTQFTKTNSLKEFLDMWFKFKIKEIDPRVCTSIHFRFNSKLRLIETIIPGVSFTTEKFLQFFSYINSDTFYPDFIDKFPVGDSIFYKGDNGSVFTFINYFADDRMYLELDMKSFKKVLKCLKK